MATSRLDRSGAFHSVVIHADSAQFALPHHGLLLRKNGVEFHSPKAFPLWKEMTVTLRSPREGTQVRCTGVVVACDGNRHMGYTVSLLFLNLSRQSQERLSGMVEAR